jgi:hypothetical protein
LQRALAGLGVANDVNVRREVGNLLVGRGYDDDGVEDLMENSDDALKQEFAAEGEPRFGPDHAATLAAAKDDGG